MKSFLTICVLASMAFAVNAFPQPEESENSEFLKCAMDKFSRIFVHITFIDGSIACLKDDTSEYANKAREIIAKVKENIVEMKQYYETAPDCDEKYHNLYNAADQVLADNENIRAQVAKLSTGTQECIDSELMKATNRVNDAKTCYDD